MKRKLKEIKGDVPGDFVQYRTSCSVVLPDLVPLTTENLEVICSMAPENAAAFRLGVPYEGYVRYSRGYKPTKFWPVEYLRMRRAGE